MKALGPEDPQFLGKYRLIGRLGAGGMGQVFLAVSPGGRRVAVKVVHPEFIRDPEFSSRFRREVLANRLVSGAYTAPVIDADTYASPPWLATAYVPGPSLQQSIDANGPLPAATVLALAAGLAEALTSIHGAGLVHRDLKPSNVLLAEDGPRVIDFGIARISDTSTITQTGTTIGSPGYMSPEQVSTGEITPASDVFSLGAVLAYAATGTNPFGDGPTPALLYRVVHTSPALEAVADPGLRALVADCLAKAPEQRPSPDDILARVAAGSTRTILLVTGAWSPVADRVRTSDQVFAAADTVTRTVADARPVPSDAVPTPLDGTTARRGYPRRAVVLASVAAVVGAGVPLGLRLARSPGHVSVPPPVGAWRLDEAGGTIAHDSAGNHDGTTEGVHWRQGPGSAAVFENGEVVTRGPVVDTGPGSSYTVSARVRLSGMDEWFATAVSQSAGKVIAFYLQYSSEDHRWAFSTQGNVRALSKDKPAIQVWTHLVGVRKDDQLLLYVDGTPQNTATATFSEKPSSSDSLFIGRALYDGSPEDWFPGSIKNVQVFDQALSPAQVKALYDG